MKKKFAHLAFLGIVTFSLTACAEFADMFYFGENPLYPTSGNAGYQSISTPPAGDLTPNYASLTYKDYILNNCYPLSATPATGNAKLLVIPVWFSDSANYVSAAKKTDVKNDIQKAYFGTNEDTGWRSVKTYYEEESGGLAKLTGKVSDWYNAGYAASHYASDANVTKTTTLAKTAINWYFNNNPSESRKDYDCDGDGYLDGVMFIYAAPDCQALGLANDDNYKNLWAYCYWIQDTKVKNVDNPGANAFFWASYDFMYGRNDAKSRTGSDYSNGDTSVMTIDTHTYIHEMGHMFGLVDYYDYSSYEYRPAGDFSMQDHTVGGHDPFSSYSLGWGKAYVPTSANMKGSETVINLKPFATSGEMIVLSPSWNQYNSPFDEYLILEYYTPTGLNEFDANHVYMNNPQNPTGSLSPGIRLWHVDARLVCPSGYNADARAYTFGNAKVTTNPRETSTYGVTMMMSNTYDDGYTPQSYLSPLGGNYTNYNLLQLIRNSSKESHLTKSSFMAGHLFGYGSTFRMEDYAKQFVNSGLLDSGKALNFTFEVMGLMEEYASIKITKL